MKIEEQINFQAAPRDDYKLQPDEYITPDEWESLNAMLCNDFFSRVKDGLLDAQFYKKKYDNVSCLLFTLHGTELYDKLPDYIKTFIEDNYKGIAHEALSKMESE